MEFEELINGGWGRHESETEAVAADLEEHVGLVEDAGQAAGLRELLDAYQAQDRAPWGEAPRAVEIDELRLSQLRALGYSLRP